MSGLYDAAASVIERYWLSSSGVALIVDPAVPLFLLKNETNICFLSSGGEWPYTKSDSFLKYDICSIEKDTRNYLNTLHLNVLNKYFARPSGVPDELMFKRPIWSTWVYFKKFIDEYQLKQYARDIVANNYTHSQLEIDDKWQTAYGDFKFSFKFPNMSAIVADLNAMGFRTTLWVHPFANLFSNNYVVMQENLYGVTNQESRICLILFALKWFKVIIQC